MQWWRSSIDEHRNPRAPVTELLVGQIASPHGLRGEVSIKVLSENESRFSPGSRLWVGPESESAKTMEVEGMRSHSGRALVKFAGVDDRISAEALRGLLVFVGRDQIPKLEKDAYWEHELVGAAVIDPSGKPLGTLTGIEERFEQDLWRVEAGSGPVLVPAAKDIIVSVDLKQRRVVVDAPQGLFPEEASSGDEQP